MNKAIPLTLATLAFTFSSFAYSAQFSSVIDAMAIPKNVKYNVSSWENIDKIQGVAWEVPYDKLSDDPTIINGITYVGDTRLNISGNSNFMESIDISIETEGEGENPFESADYSERKIIKLIGPGKLIRIPTLFCEVNGHDFLDNTYQFKRLKNQPVFIRHTGIWNPTLGYFGSRHENITVSNELHHLNNFDESCYDTPTYEKWEVD